MEGEIFRKSTKSGTKNSKIPRPSNSQYGHKDIKATLEGMSFHKCFYCESDLKTHKPEIDHFMEVSEDRTLAFEWTNLYLSCDNCNDKQPNKSISITDVLDPCKDSDKEILKHISFNDEIIIVKDGSQIGLKTIQKYKLDSKELDYRRFVQRKFFVDQLLIIKNNQIKEGRKGMTQKEIDKLNQFKQSNRPFSLMFKILLEKYL
ncbi:MAG: HNH endonuclease [Saprospiraceae bacterium]